MQTDITQIYSQWTFMHDNQIHAMEIKDPAWRQRNHLYLVQPTPAARVIDPPTVECPSLKMLDTDYLGSGLIDVVSARLLEFLKLRIRAEFIPIHLLHRGQAYTERQFFLMHLLDQFSAMDLEKSIYTKYPEEEGGGIDRIEKLILRKAALGNSLAFILDEIPLLCVRNDLAEEMQTAGFKGLKFNPLDTYQNVKPR